MAIWQVTHLQRLLGQEVRNVFHYTAAPTSLSAAQLQELADDIKAIYVAGTEDANRTNDWSLYGVNVRRVDVAGVPGQDVGFTGGSLVGASAGENVPTQIAILVHGVSYVTKPNRVRSYLAGHSISAIADGLVDAAFRTSALGLIQALDTLTIDGQTFSRVSAQWDALHETVVAFNEIDNYFVSDVPATQRRRRIGRGA